MNRRGRSSRLQLTSKGEKWLSGSIDEQYAADLRPLEGPRFTERCLFAAQGFLFPGLDPYNHYGPGDTRFLGEALVLKVDKGKPMPYYWEAKPEDQQALRKSLDRALAVMKPGVFYRLDSIAPHLAFGEHNPLNLGLAPDEVDRLLDESVVPPWRSSVRRPAGS